MTQFTNGYNANAAMNTTTATGYQAPAASYGAPVAGGYQAPVAKVPFKQASPAEKQARVDANWRKTVDFCASQGLDPRTITRTFGALSAATVTDGNMKSSTGRVGHRYFVSVYAPDDPMALKSGNYAGCVRFNFHTFAPGMIALFDKVVAAKQINKTLPKNAQHKLSVGVISGLQTAADGRSFRSVAMIDLTVDKHQVDLKHFDPRSLMGPVMR